MSLNRMVGRAIVLAYFACMTPVLWGQGQGIGGVRGMVYDQDFEAPLPGAEVLLFETGDKRETTDQGNYIFGQVAPGTYTLIFSKDGYTRQVKGNVVVTGGGLTEVDASLPGEYTEMEEFIVQDLDLGGGSEISLLNMRMDAPAMMSGISADMMSQAGASDAASALRLVSGATVQDGKYAVVRGLPDRYVNSQLNGVRLPTADSDKRAVQLDQFPAALLESIQVSKTFMPFQQGDASGGAVNVVTKGIPEETTFSFSSQIGSNSQVTDNDFLTYKGGGVDFWGMDDGGRDIQSDRLGQNWGGAVGVSGGSEPIDYKWSMSGGTKKTLDSGIKVGGFGSFFYEQDSSFFDNGIDDKYWVETPGDPMTPQYSDGSPTQGEFNTSLFDVTQGSQEVKWGGLATVGLETEKHRLSLLYMYTRSAEDTATLAENTRGKAYYYPGYNAYDPTDPGNTEDGRDDSPYLRTQTLEYTERTTQTLQLSGHHMLPELNIDFSKYITLLEPELDWGVALSSAGMDQPDKRQFGSQWMAESDDLGSPNLYLPYKPAANYTLGNLQRIWKEIAEDSQQVYTNTTLPFEQWNEEEGYLKFGLFHDKVDRDYKQESFSNFNNNTPYIGGTWDHYWTDVYATQSHPITAGEVDVDYSGEQKISAGYGMVDMPLNASLNVIGGFRYEKTDLSMTNSPEGDATWIDPATNTSTQLGPGDADVSFSQTDVLPSIGAVYEISKAFTLRGSYSETVARQTFKELSPIQQMEYLGGDVFVGNPDLQMSGVKNYDLRLDFTPYEGGLLSVSYFYKDIENPIEYVQRVADFIYTTPVNYPKGKLSGWELEIRQQMGQFKDSLDGLSLGANFTLIDSEVTLPSAEAAKFDQPNIRAPMSTRDMTDAPEYLFNLFMSYDLSKRGLKGTQVGLFYTMKGDALVAGAGQKDGNYIPNIYDKAYDTLNLSVTQKIKDRWKLKFQVKNLTDPKIQRVYRSDYVSGDKVKTSYTRGLDFNLSLAYSF
ncbi:MAG: TonB-dependent receptor [Phycisphaeraceae bacterium]|nr:TonB-dependent receptor [Phycisphaeraceae bacterium]